MMSRSSATVCILPLLALGFAGCGGGGHEEAEKKLPAVTFRYPIAKKVPYYAYFTGRTAAREDVDVRARVNGYLVAINFKPGDIVKPNEVLFEIDPRPYQADLDKADARIALVDAEYKLAAANLARERELVEKKATSARDLEVMEAKMKASAAEMSAAKAQKEMAVLNLDWCKVRVPEVPPLLDPKTKEPLIDPKTKKEMAPPLAVGRNLLTLGNLVSANVTQLTTIVSEDPMFAYFDVDENTMLNIKKMVQEGAIKGARETEVPIELGLSNEGGEYPHSGTVDFINPSVNARTGALQVRGVFDNPINGKGKTRQLVPGLFVRIRLKLGEDRPSLVVPQAAIETELGKKVVMVVDKDDKVERRPVVLGPELPDNMQVIEPEKVIRTKEGMRPVREGEKGEDSISVSDRVIVSGLQRIRAGMTVTASEGK